MGLLYETKQKIKRGHSLAAEGGRGVRAKSRVCLEVLSSLSLLGKESKRHVEAEKRDMEIRHMKNTKKRRGKADHYQASNASLGWVTWLDGRGDNSDPLIRDCQSNSLLLFLLLHHLPCSSLVIIDRKRHTARSLPRAEVSSFFPKSCSSSRFHPDSFQKEESRSQKQLTY